MGQRHRPGVTPERAAEQQTRDQEVLRANRELAAYFKGRRTEREARAALKIIKAFIRDRERRGVSSRPPVPTEAEPQTSRQVVQERDGVHRAAGGPGTSAIVAPPFLSLSQATC
jgi:hypothetical protein